MSRLGSHLLERIDLRPGEEIRQSWMANRSVGWRAVGGKLFLTTERFIFLRHFLERLIPVQDQPWSREREDFVGAEVFGAEAWPVRPLSGALRSRLCLVFVDESVELFVVWRPARAVAGINELLDGSPTSTAIPSEK